MRRHDFIVGGIAAGLAGKAWSGVRPNQAKLDRLAVMTLFFDPILKGPAPPDDPARRLDILDVPQMITDRYGIDYVEFQHTHFAATETPYLKETVVEYGKSRKVFIAAENRGDFHRPPLVPGGLPLLLPSTGRCWWRSSRRRGRTPIPISATFPMMRSGSPRCGSCTPSRPAAATLITRRIDMMKPLPPDLQRSRIPGALLGRSAKKQRPGPICSGAVHCRCFS
jgi:hypothetical protein